MKELEHWIKKITENASWRMIADKLGTTHSTIQRRLKQDTATAICELAEAYGANPVEGLLSADVISTDQVQQFAKQESLSNFTDLELAKEIVRRLEEAQDENVQAMPSRLSVVPDSEVEGALEDVRNGLAAAKGGVDDYDEPEAP